MEVALGAIVSILITIWAENLRRPRLQLKIAQPADGKYQDRPARLARFLHLELINKPLPRWARWMSRQAAIQCHGTITFHHLDGQNIFGRAMSVRWSGSPEPTLIYLEIEGKRIAIIDPTKFTLVSRIDVYPGEAEVLDVAARFDNENDCYGWSNENYFSNPIWRNPNWKLPQGRYLVNVTVVSSGEKCAGIFHLINDVLQQDFRIEPAQKNDKVYS